MRIKALIFSGGLLPSSIGVMLSTWSIFSHVAIELVDGRNLDATLLEGVSIHKPGNSIGRWQKRVDLDGVFTLQELQTASERVKSQLGKTYDTDWLFDYLFKKQGRWQDQDKWVCSELIWYAFDRLQTKPQHRITPKNVWHAVRRLKGR